MPAGAGSQEALPASFTGSHARRAQGHRDAARSLPGGPGTTGPPGLLCVCSPQAGLAPGGGVALSSDDPGAEETGGRGGLLCPLQQRLASPAGGAQLHPAHLCSQESEPGGRPLLRLPDPGTHTGRSPAL